MTDKTIVESIVYDKDGRLSLHEEITLSDGSDRNHNCLKLRFGVMGVEIYVPELAYNETLASKMHLKSQGNHALRETIAEQRREITALKEQVNSVDKLKGELAETHISLENSKEACDEWFNVSKIQSRIIKEYETLAQNMLG